MGGRSLIVGIALCCACKRAPSTPAHDANGVVVVNTTIDAMPIDAPGPLPAIAVEVPTTAAELQAWLVAAHYQAVDAPVEAA